MEAAILGIGETRFSKAAEESEVELAVSATQAATADAGIDVRELDGAVRFSSDATSFHHLLRSLDVKQLRFFGEIAYGGSAAAATLVHAAAAVEAGLASHVLCFRALKGRSKTRLGRAERALGNEVTAVARGDLTTPSGVLAAPFGLLAPAQVIALWAQRYRHVHAIDPERFESALGTVAVTLRDYAQRNLRATTRGRPLTLASYRAGRMITTPFRSDDLCRETDGAVAIVVGRSKPDRRAIAILAGRQYLSRYSETLPVYTGDITRAVPESWVDALLDDAGVTRGDVDVAGAYDATTFSVIAALEDLGFCGRGDGVDFVLDGGIGIDGPLPTNTAGGLLSEGHVHGLNIVTEVVRQLRGESANQRHGAHVGVVYSRASAVVLAA